MKILHTSDWHIGHMLYNWDRSDEHQAFFNKLEGIIISEKPDAMIVSGDIFHTSAPSAASHKLYIENMLRLHEAAPEMTIAVIAGNHDSSTRLETDRNLWEHFNLDVTGSISRDISAEALDRHIVTIGQPAKGYIIAIPHCYPQNFPDMGMGLPREERPAGFINALLSRVSEINKDNLPVIMTAHATVMGSDPKKQDIIVGGLDSIDISELGDGYDYLALGHIHFPQNIGEKARYSGSPIPISFNEDYPHSVTIIDTGLHGEEINLKTIGIPVMRPVITLPEGDPVPFEDALRLLQEFPADKEGYIRLNVRVSQYGGADWAAKAMAATEGRKCRYCYIHLSCDPATSGQRERLQFSQEELKEMSPIDVARIHWREEKGCEMDEELEARLTDLINKTEADNHEA